MRHGLGPHIECVSCGHMIDENSDEYFLAINEGEESNGDIVCGGCATDAEKDAV